MNDLRVGETIARIEGVGCEDNTIETKDRVTELTSTRVGEV